MYTYIFRLGSGRRGKVDVNWGVIEVNKGTKVDRSEGGDKKELKNCLTSFVNVPIHTPILGKTQSIRKIYIYIKHFTDNIQDTVNNRA